MKLSRRTLVLTVAVASLFGCGGAEDTSGAGGGQGSGGAGGAGTGALSCPSHFADCDGDPQNGCEGALSTSVENCGACGVKCEGAAHAAPLCSAGACLRACEAGFADCNKDPADGCEVDMMSDVAHCGSCERSCNNACVKGACDVIILATGQSEPGSLALDETSLYWANMSASVPGAGSIMKVAKGGGAPVTLADKQATPQSIALDAASIYWVNQGTPPLFIDGSVRTVAKDGSGTPVEIAAGQAAPFGVAVQGNALYWTTKDQIMMIDRADPSAKPVALASGQTRPREIVIVGTTLYWANFGTVGNVPSADGSIMMLPQGGAPMALASNLTLASGLVTDTALAYLYWRVEGALMRAPLGGGSPEVFVGGLDSPPWRIAADEATVYWTTLVPFGGAVNAAAVSSRQGSPLAPNQVWPWALAMDQTSVYWTSYGDGMKYMTGTVAKIAR